MGIKRLQESCVTRHGSSGGGIFSMTLSELAGVSDRIGCWADADLGLRPMLIVPPNALAQSSFLGLDHYLR